MWIEELQWDDANIEHIARHNVTAAEDDEAIFEGVLPAYNHRGVTITLARASAGRHLTIVLRSLKKGVWRPITARDMTSAERRLALRRN